MLMQPKIYYMYNTFLSLLHALNPLSELKFNVRIDWGTSTLLSQGCLSAYSAVNLIFGLQINFDKKSLT